MSHDRTQSEVELMETALDLERDDQGRLEAYADGDDEFCDYPTCMNRPEKVCDYCREAVCSNHYHGSLAMCAVCCEERYAAGQGGEK